jgi:transposase
MNQVHPLTTQEIKALKRLHRQTTDANVRSRCDMILCSNEGLSPPRIARRVRFSHDTVCRYIARYEAEGISGLLTKSRSGRPRKVSAKYEKLLLELVEQVPREVGMPFSNWTTANLATEMAKRTGIEITPRQVENYLKRHDWRLRRPVRTVKHKQDTELVAEKKTNA